jgi:Cu+-exporting ATPase
MTSSLLSDPRPPNLRVASKGSGDANDPSLKDPVCGMKVTVLSPNTLRHRGTQSYFCGPGCQVKFLANPAKFHLSADSAGFSSKETAEPVAPGAIYTCPMHPQIRQVGPGSCPICGMALEPVAPTADISSNPELVDMRRRFWIGVPLALAVLVLAMGHNIPGLAAIANASWSPWVQFALSTPVVLW